MCSLQQPQQIYPFSMARCALWFNFVSIHWSFPNMAISRPAILVLPEDTGRSASRGVPFFSWGILAESGESRWWEKSLGRKFGPVMLIHLVPYAYAHIYICLHTQTHAPSYVCMYVMYVCMYIYIHMYVYMYRYIYVYAFERRVNQHRSNFGLIYLSWDADLSSWIFADFQTAFEVIPRLWTKGPRQVAVRDDHYWSPKELAEESAHLQNHQTMAIFEVKSSTKRYWSGASDICVFHLVASLWC